MSRKCYVTDDITIDDKDECIKHLASLSGLSIDDINLDEIINFINSEENAKFYLTEKLELKSKDTRFLWLDSGLTTKRGDNPIFISLLSNWDDGTYVGHIVGMSGQLATRTSEYYTEYADSILSNELDFRDRYESLIAGRKHPHLTGQKPTVAPKEPVKKSVNSIRAEEQYWTDKAPLDLTLDIEKSLMFNPWHTIYGMNRYIKIIGCRIPQLIIQKKTDYYLTNNTGSVIINTGLLDKFGNDIYVMYKVNRSMMYFTPSKIIESKRDYLTEKFIKDLSESNFTLKPISFFDEGDRFDANIEQIDITSRALYHIIEERKDRFPEGVRELPVSIIATQIRGAIEIALKLQERDGTYAKPNYSSKQKGITWMLPFHINTAFNEEPELVLVLRKEEPFYVVKTILPYDDEVKDKIIDLSLYGRLW